MPILNEIKDKFIARFGGGYKCTLWLSFAQQGENGRFAVVHLTTLNNFFTFDTGKKICSSIFFQFCRTVVKILSFYDFCRNFAKTDECSSKLSSAPLQSAPV
jgi:hypothetical protein